MDALLIGDGGAGVANPSMEWASCKFIMALVGKVILAIVSMRSFKR